MSAYLVKNITGYDDMAQHFLLSAAARTLSLKEIYKAGEAAAYATFLRLRWPETNGEPVCPDCGCCDVYAITTRRRFKCAACLKQFSVTSGTIFASRKLSFCDLLAAICLFVNGTKGRSAVQFSREMNVQYKTAWVVSHKLREAMQDEVDGLKVGGEVEILACTRADISAPPTLLKIASTAALPNTRPARAALSSRSALARVARLPSSPSRKLKASSW